MDAGRNPITGANPVPLAIRSGLGMPYSVPVRAIRPSMRRAWRPISPPAFPTIRSARRTTARRSPISPAPSRRSPRSASSMSPALFPAIPASCSSCRAVRSASRSAREYRKETASYEQDPFVTNGFTNGVSIPSFDPEPFEVKEAFGEIRIPYSEGFALLPRADGQRRRPRREISGRGRNRLVV